MSHPLVYPVPASAAKRSLLNNEQYMQMYQQSVSSPEAFWAEHGKRLHWFTPFTKVKNTSFDSGKVHINWFSDGALNASYNCLDRHLPERANQVAYYWEGDSPDVQKSVTYAQLHQQVCKLANGMKELGIKKGDRVTIYLPMIPEATVALLACARIGAVHSVVFAGFSPDALGSRIIDCDSKLVITADQALRGSRVTNLKDNTDMALAHLGADSPVKHVLVVKHVGKNVDMQAGQDGRDVWYHDLLNRQSADCPAEPMNAEDPLFILYTSGSTGKPKGVLHTTGGYMVWASMTHQYVFDYHDGDIYWCAADIGWVTGHTYIVYGPLANGATSVLFEGVPNYPSVKRMAQIVDKYKVNILYTAPTAIRALMAHGDAPVEGASLTSLQTLGSVGEPINPEAWNWYHEKFGNGNCPIVDTWWQTETGGILITPLPGCTELKPGSATRPFFGVKPAIVDNEGKELSGECEGNLVIKDSWPGQMRTVYGDHERFEQTYFSTYPGLYFTGDGAKRDADGYYWLTGRVDDVLNISGHRLGTAEIESCLVAHDAVAEAAVVGYPHDIKGQGIYVYVTPRVGIEPSSELTKALRDWVREEISPIATPDLIQWAPTGLPKTRSGKIMRRILRKIAANEHDQLGDISTLADPSVVETLVTNRLNRK
ncbi:MAG: acetate--CoA ligase [Gammaproteobacteria bacterium HGW-Gammaproteobacteria-15]|nr:MAG: acetate--CoA ligase [Gammaproteobacteria bacterium HGW-Gammaproteobacteria-15]